MRKISFINGNYYHIYNRGVSKEEIFRQKTDYFRFLIDINHFSMLALGGHLSRVDLVKAKLRPNRPQDRLVEVVCYCLMPNHFHFILYQSQDDGISRFMHRLGTGYTKYFNLKYDRSGVLFQGSFKAKEIEDDQYLLQLSKYVHLNPNAHIGEEGALSYKWSSLSYYLNPTKPCLVQLKKDIVLGQFNDVADYKRFSTGQSLALTI